MSLPLSLSALILKVVPITLTRDSVYAANFFVTNSWRLYETVPGYELQLAFQSFLKLKQEAQLMLTNPRDAFRGQSRSPNRHATAAKTAITHSVALVKKTL